MRWYKHQTNSHNDEKLAEIVHEFGLEGYGFWWLLLEIIGKEMNGADKCELSYPLATWSRKLQCSKRKTSTLFQKFSEISLIFLEYDGENSVGKLRVSVPNLLKYRDEYSKKSGQTPDKKTKVSGAKKQTAESETETEAEKQQPAKLSRQEVRDLYARYAGVLMPNQGQIAILSDFAERFTAEAITEAFQSAAGGGKVSQAGFLNWCMKRMERREHTPEPIGTTAVDLCPALKGAR